MLYAAPPAHEMVDERDPSPQNAAGEIDLCAAVVAAKMRWGDTDAASNGWEAADSGLLPY